MFYFHGNLRLCPYSFNHDLDFEKSDFENSKISNSCTRLMKIPTLLTFHNFNIKKPIAKDFLADLPPTPPPLHSSQRNFNKR
jgi:hypothetical protein